MDGQTNRREVSVPKTELSKLLLKNWTAPFLFIFPPIASSLFIVVVVVVVVVLVVLVVVISFRHSFIRVLQPLTMTCSIKFCWTHIYF
jgi:hypothetical protein